MRALQMVKWQTPPQLRDVESPVPGPGEVLAKVEATGLCHSDLHVMDWREGTLKWDLPVTLGHETAGTVASLGAGARGIAEGEPVLVYGPWGCGRCRRCARGEDNLCDRRRRGCGLGFDGGLAEYVVGLRHGSSYPGVISRRSAERLDRRRADLMMRSRLNSGGWSQVHRWW